MIAIGFFMHFYPAYTIQEVLDEYAIRFYKLLDVATELKSQEELGQITISSFPHLTKTEQNRITNQYRKIFSENDDKSSTIQKDRERLKKLIPLIKK